MKNKIFVHLYSYKEKDLLSFVQSIFDSSSQNNQIDIYITDQNNLTRLKQFIDYKNVFYNVVWWDEFISPNYYIQSAVTEAINKEYDYALLLKQNIALPKNWDEDLIQLIPNNGVFSGQGKNKLSIEKNFYIGKEKRMSKEITNTSFIDRNFIFCKINNLKNIIFPFELKYYGDEEYLSIQFLNNGLFIYSLPTKYYNYISEPIHKRGYVPFSLNHNYNDLISLLKDNKTLKLPYKDPSLFLNNINLDISNLYKLPFDFNDIEYDRSSSLDNLGGKRYIERLNSVS